MLRPRAEMVSVGILKSGGLVSVRGRTEWRDIWSVCCMKVSACAEDDALKRLDYYEGGLEWKGRVDQGGAAQFFTSPLRTHNGVRCDVCVCELPSVDGCGHYGVQV